MLSMTHMAVLFVVVLVIFGPHKLPELARGLGKLMAEYGYSLARITLFGVSG